MITNVCLLLEMLSFTFCLHALYREKFRLDITTISFLAIYMIIMALINYYALPQQYTLIMYMLIILYCGVKFKFNIKIILINVIFSIIIIGGIQMLIMLILFYVLDISWFTDYQLLLANCLAFLVIVLLLPKSKIYKVMNYLQTKEKIQNIVLAICIALIVYCLLSYKEFTRVELNQAILLFISISCIFVLAEQLGRYKVKAKEAETELKMHKLYADSFQGLIENIRLRQHEIDNHIHTIYSQHYIYNTYTDLVKAQDDYCRILTQENRFNKLLKSRNHIIAGFLYGKFVEIDKLGIEVDYEVKIMDLNVNVPIYKIVEILGDLINNAVEALERTEGINKLYVSLVENERFEIEVRNESPFIDYDMIEQFFTKGFSNKGQNRGLGLYNVKNICKEFALDICCENINIDGINWLSFKIIKDNTISSRN
ncbi:GHKL domain-containing protein [Parablautia intestinalis]|uniref:GHKL domain-containing protein n=1 Tax=Parablautia intestinalis TaxID=2320100 RepID=A0A3A9AFS2_9FIRM|nr:ATP-binding protein [Parablautia intestinalis]RKI90128.1 GHKL domain-containing protein [Parablautia intestinalis]